jgi:predicted acylesterase/phospholipase RssA
MAQREVWFSRGPLFDAIRASIAIPTDLRPHYYEGRTLVDGGLLNPVPITPTLRDLTDCTIRRRHQRAGRAIGRGARCRDDGCSRQHVRQCRAGVLVDESSPVQASMPVAEPVLGRRRHRRSFRRRSRRR